MKEACKLFIGTYDFRNFAKLDVTTTTNYEREVRDIYIEKIENQQELIKNDNRMNSYVVTIIGNSFIWH